MLKVEKKKGDDLPLLLKVKKKKGDGLPLSLKVKNKQEDDQQIFGESNPTKTEMAKNEIVKYLLRLIFLFFVSRGLCSNYLSGIAAASHSSTMAAKSAGSLLPLPADINSPI